MEIPEEEHYSRSLAHTCPLYGIDGYAKNERDLQISRCFTIQNPAIYVWGEETPAFRPMSIPVAVSQVACGSQHIAFLTVNGQVYTFGGNDVSQCGLGSDSLDYVDEPSIVSSLVHGGVTVTSVVCGPSQTAGIASSQEVYLWGMDSVTQKKVDTPQCFRYWGKIGETKKLVQLVFGSDHTAVLVEDEEVNKNEVWVWGTCSEGQLGLGKERDTRRHPTMLDLPDDVSQMCSSETHMAALTRKGEVFIWGKNEDGVLGVGGEEVISSPTLVEFEKDIEVVMVSCGVGYTSVIDKDGDIYSWGRNDHGQLGLGHEDLTINPTLAKIEDPFEVCLVKSGGEHNIAVTTDRKALLWGSGAEYRMNPASEADNSVPTILAADPVMVEVGSNFTVAMFGTVQEIMEIPAYTPPHKTPKGSLPDLRARKKLKESSEDVDAVKIRMKRETPPRSTSPKTPTSTRSSPRSPTSTRSTSPRTPSSTRSSPRAMVTGRPPSPGHLRSSSPRSARSSSPRGATSPRIPPAGPVSPMPVGQRPKSPPPMSLPPKSPPLTMSPPPVSPPPKSPPPKSPPQTPPALSSLPSLPPALSQNSLPPPLPLTSSSPIAKKLPPMTTNAPASSRTFQMRKAGARRPMSSISSQSPLSSSPLPPSISAPKGKPPPVAPIPAPLGGGLNATTSTPVSSPRGRGEKSPRSFTYSGPQTSSLAHESSPSIKPTPPTLPLPQEEEQDQDKKKKKARGRTMQGMESSGSTPSSSTSAAPLSSGSKSRPKLSRENSTIIAVPRQVMSPDADLPIRIALRSANNIPSKNCFVSFTQENREALAQQSSHISKVVSPNKQSASWDEDFDLKVTPHQSTWFLFLMGMKKEQSVVLAKFYVHVHSLNLGPDEVVEMELSDMNSSKATLSVEVSALGWSPTVSNPDAVPMMTPRARAVQAQKKQKKPRTTRARTNRPTSFLGNVLGMKKGRSGTIRDEDLEDMMGDLQSKIDHSPSPSTFRDPGTPPQSASPSSGFLSSSSLTTPPSSFQGSSSSLSTSSSFQNSSSSITPSSSLQAISSYNNNKSPRSPAISPIPAPLASARSPPASARTDMPSSRSQTFDSTSLPSLSSSPIGLRVGGGGPSPRPVMEKKKSRISLAREKLKPKLENRPAPEDQIVRRYTRKV